MNPYEILGLDKNAPNEVIKIKFRKMAQKLHPDREGGSMEKFLPIKLAYDVLGDPARKKRYDETGSTISEGEIDNKVKNEVMSVILAAIEGAPDPFVVDIIGNCHKMIQNGIDEDKKTVAVQRKLLKKYSKISQRLKAKKGKKNLLTDMMKGRVEQVEKTIVRLEEHQMLGAKMLVFLADYDFEMDDLPEDDFQPGWAKLVPGM